MVQRPIVIMAPACRRTCTAAATTSAVRMWSPLTISGWLKIALASCFSNKEYIYIFQLKCFVFVRFRCMQLGSGEWTLHRLLSCVEVQESRQE